MYGGLSVANYVPDFVNVWTYQRDSLLFSFFLNPLFLFLLPQNYLHMEIVKGGGVGVLNGEFYINVWLTLALAQCVVACGRYLPSALGSSPLGASLLSLTP